jgi:hypothetical protein
MTVLRWASTSFVIALGALAVAGGLSVAPELIVVDRRAAAGVAILGALLLAAGFILRPYAPTRGDRPTPKSLRVLASMFVIVFGGLLVAHDLAAPPIHADAAAFEIVLGALMLISGLVLRPRAERTEGSK